MKPLTINLELPAQGAAVAANDDPRTWSAAERARISREYWAARGHDPLRGGGGKPPARGVSAPGAAESRGDRIRRVLAAVRANR